MFSQIFPRILAMAQTSTRSPADGCLERGPLQGESDGTVLPLTDSDVFINHCDPDVKRILVNHVAAALATIHVRVFADVLGIEVRDQVIRSVINNSKIYVSIFSSGYAESAWCLEELRFIMECSRNNSERFFLPVFFHVTPKDLRLLMPSTKSCYDSAFAKHATTYKASTINTWKEALYEASNFEGFVFPDDFQGFEAEVLVESIVWKVVEKLNKPMLLHEPEHPVGLDEKLQGALVCMDKGYATYGVKSLGIYGMGGMGKTTLAKSIYNKIYAEFQAACFIEDVSKRHKSVGLTGLQKDLLQQLLKPMCEIFLPNTGSARHSMMQERLAGKKVLIVLDDLSERTQIEELFSAYVGHLYPGSQFVLTTRDREVLRWAGVRTSFLMKGLSRDHALQLFNLHAFPSRGEPSIDSKPLQTGTKLSGDWQSLAERVADACQGLPLALEVLGSFLRGKDISLWGNTVKALENERMVDPQREVTAILKISFDALHSKEEKEMFLDAACFLFQEPKKKAMRIWRSEYGDSEAELYLNNLISKCLVNLDKNGDLTMHDLLRGMGREIVDNSCKHYWKKSHLWREEDVDRVLDKGKGTSYVRGLCSKTQKKWDTSSFIGMDELKLLVLDKVTLTGDFGNVFRELRWFQLRNSPLEIPLLLALENVAVLDLEGCHITSFSCGDSKLQNLKELNLNNCSNLKELLIDFSKSSRRLEDLSLSGCVNLERLPDSICELRSSLTHLDVSSCTKLTALHKIGLEDAGLMTLPQSFTSLISLQSLRLGHFQCESITGLPEDIGRLRKLVELHLSDMKRLLSLPHSISSLFMLKVLNLQGCSSLQEIRELPTSLASLVVVGCTSLEYLDTSACSKLQGFPDGLETLHNLSDLSLREYTSEQMLHSVQIKKLTSLKTLRLSQTIHEAQESIQWIQRLVSIEEVVVCVPRRSNRRSLSNQNWSRNIRLEKEVPGGRRGPCIGVLCWFWEVAGQEYADGEGTLEVVRPTGQLEFCQKLMCLPSQLGEQVQLHVAKYRASHPLVVRLTDGDTIRVRHAHIVQGLIQLMYAEDEMQQTRTHLGISESFTHMNCSSWALLRIREWSLSDHSQ